MTTSRPYLVFVSHATKDSELASRLATILDSIDLPAFVYEKDSVAGQNRFEVIRNRISECPYFIVMLTTAARRSQWVNQEIGFAAAHEKEMIPLVEVSQIRKRRIPNVGFLELSDPLDLMLARPQDAIGETLRTLMEYARRDHYWRGLIRLQCICGWRGRKGTGNLTRWEWDCPSCQAKISHSPLTFEPLTTDS